MSKKIRNILSILKGLNLFKTIYFNFHYLPFKQAIQLPIFIYAQTKLVKMKGEIHIASPLRPGLIRIGSYALGTLDMKYDRTIWQCDGSVAFDGIAFIGQGSRLSILRGAKLTIGKEFCITGGSSIICSKSISFGERCLLSWDILIMDTDFHYIYDKLGNIINEDKSITIGNHVWIGCRNTILKGVKIADNVVIAAGSKIVKEISQSTCIVGGVDTQRILKDAVYWKS